MLGRESASAMSTPPVISVPPKCNADFTRQAVVKGVWAGAAITVSMLLCSWLGLVGFDEPNPFQLLMVVLNLPPILFVAGGAKGRTGDYIILVFLIVVWWAVIGSLVGYLVARIRPRRK